jgi:hypothetical protein
MYDAIDLDAIPGGALAVAGYVDGAWPTWEDVQRRWPFSRLISIATRHTSVADVLDIEQGDATSEQLLAWLELAHSNGVARPGIYASLSPMRGLLDVAHAGGWTRPRLKLWAAHWTGQPHICAPRCGYGLNTTVGATQWRGPGPGHRFDESLATPTFLNT